MLHIFFPAGVFGPEDQRLELAFKYAVKSVIIPGTRLVPEIIKLPDDDSFRTSMTGNYYQNFIMDFYF